MARKKFGLEFEGMEELIKRLEDSESDLKQATESALKKTFDVVTSSIQTAINSSPYNFNRPPGKTKASLETAPNIEWEGPAASVPVGFDIDKGGLPSIFLMYGTPTIKPDKQLYNSIYGSAIKKTVGEVQEEAFREILERLGK